MSGNSKKVVTRFAPSPTGYLHIGGYRTAIFSYLFAKHNDGDFILRIEDTDKERNKKEYEDNILESLKWIGLEYDKFYRQSENLERHKAVIQELIKKGKAYISKEEAKDGSGAIKEVVRFKNPNKIVEIHDLVKGLVRIDTTDLGDFVIARNIEDPLYHLAVVIDDWDEGVTHVIRGEEHLSNTPRQILMIEAIGAQVPTYAHIPLVLGEDKQKLSKRKGALPLTAYRDQGYLPEAILNAAVLIGWNPGGEQEIFTKEELVKIFDLHKVQKGGAVFNPIKLDWINKEHIKRLSTDVQIRNIKERLPQTDLAEKIAPIIIDRINKWSDVDAMLKNGELDWVFKEPKYEANNLIWKKSNAETAKSNLEKVKELIEPIQDFSEKNIKEAIWNFAEKKGRGDVLWPMRYALSGLDKSPDPFVLAAVLGKEETIARINKAISLL